ncbi:bidirectional sugar transporter SWEET14-like [Zingiber officinale]|uniref:bidirectional sugar transporter SWEET14-like n=1 Tax=Zingiber officinale TaxID=94328 RepID=UPI001C4C600A|nr:bidirectional sugar transporter SWEET14-like [Zingiber officinale]XP_042437859.1 bidirectional sugar transporter SWEET14-like [Zingiber officinale]
MVYLAPLPTFYRVYRMRSTEGFQSVPYVVALFSAMLWIYYAIVKTDATLLITINAFGCFIETFYTAIYLIYAPRAMRVSTLLIIFLLNVVSFGSIILITQLAFHGPERVKVIGWICVGFSISVFAAPLSIIRLVVRTRSVEYMPFYLSLFLTISAVAWFAYGLLIRDLYVLLPNILGLIFGATQMVLYVIVSTRQLPTLDPTMPEHVIAITVVPLNSTLGIEPNQFENRFEMIECNHENSCSADKANHDDTGKAATEDISSGMNGGA